jgi:integrase
MGSVYQVGANKKWRVEWLNAVTQKKETIQIGTLSASQAKIVALNLDRLEAAQLAGVMPKKAALTWFRTLSGSLQKKFVLKGLVADYKEVPRTFAAFCAYTIETQGGTGRTRSNKIRGLRHAISFFEGTGDPTNNVATWAASSRRSLASISEDDVKEFRKQLGHFDSGKTASENSRVSAMKAVNEVFNLAVKSWVLTESPGKGLKGQFKESGKAEYVSLERFQKLYEALDREWRVILALPMFGGLRGASEINRLKWSDINFETRIVSVSQSKVVGQDIKRRDVPIFPELAEALIDLHVARDEPQEGYVVTEHRTSWNESDQLYEGYSTHITRAAKRVGQTCWKRATQNLRVSFVTRHVCGIEATEAQPMPVVCKWTGHSELIAGKHYVKISDQELTNQTNWSHEEVKQKVKMRQAAEGGTGVLSVSKSNEFQGFFQPVPPTANSHNTPTGILPIIENTRVSGTFTAARQVESQDSNSKEYMHALVSMLTEAQKRILREMLSE